MNSSYFGFFAHAGFLAGMEELDRTPCYVSGASAGALVAGLYAAGLPPREINHLIAQPELAAVFREWSAPMRLVRTLLSRRGATGALKGNKALELIKRYVGDRRLEDCDVPIAIAVANISRNRSEVKMEGPLAEYMLASCAIPGMFSTQQVEGHHFWDGGIADPIPIEPFLERRDVRRIIVHIADSNRAGGNGDQPRFWGSVGRSHELITDEFVRLKTELARARGKELHVIITRTPRLGPHKLKHGRYNIKLGRDNALANRDLIV